MHCLRKLLTSASYSLVKELSEFYLVGLYDTNTIESPRHSEGREESFLYAAYFLCKIDIIFYLLYQRRPAHANFKKPYTYFSLQYKNY